MIYQNPAFWLALVFVGTILGYFARQFIAARQASSIEERLKRQSEEAKVKAKELILEAQERATTLLEEVKKEERVEGLKETIILQNSETPNEFTFDLELKDVKKFEPHPGSSSC